MAHLTGTQLDLVLDQMMDHKRREGIAKRTVRRLLRSSRGPAITTYRFDGPRATIVAYAARYGR